MKIGLDLDNTIVDCDLVFCSVANKILGKNLEFKDRVALRSYIRKNHTDNHWTKIQSEVYGPSYKLCPPHSESIFYIKLMIDLVGNDNLYIVSHKTQFDQYGNKYNLRESADKWIHNNLYLNGVNFNRKNIIYAESIDEKIDTIVNIKCDFFLDDLPEIVELLCKKMVKGYLFNTSEPIKFQWANFYKEVLKK